MTEAELVEDSIELVRQVRVALSQDTGNPSLVSHNTHALALATASLEDILGVMESDLSKKQVEFAKSSLSSGKSQNATNEALKLEFVDEVAEVSKIKRMVASNWKLVSESQSRVKHLIAEANNQI